jgi:hypothetical protein
MAVNYANGRKIFQMVKNIPTFSIPRPSQIYLNCYFGFENKPPGNPVSKRKASIRYAGN